MNSFALFFFFGFFFFFKQKTAYEIRLSLVGSEMCIRDSVSNIAGGRIDWTVDKHVGQEVFQGLTRTWRPQLGDVLYSLVGSYGVNAMVDRDIPFTFQRHIGLIRPDVGQLLPRFLYWYLTSPPGRQQAHIRAEGLAQKAITLGGLRDFRIPVPALSRQEEIAREIDSIQLAKEALEGRASVL